MAFKHLASINNKQGFTIVELLIVIVVIGILAAITIVSYTGIASSAYAAKASSATDAYIKLLEMYKTEHGNYPQMDMMTGYACLGNADDYPAEGVFAANVCGVVDSIAVASVEESVNSALMENVRQLPSGSLPTVASNGESYRGLFYIENEAMVGVMYSLSGSQVCPQGERMYIEERSITMCMIALAD